jgi:hypothetical protein
MLMVERKAWRNGESVIGYPIANEEEREFRVRERRRRGAES